MVEPKADLYPAMRASREYWDERHEAELTALRAERDEAVRIERHTAVVLKAMERDYKDRIEALRARVAEYESALGWIADPDHDLGSADCAPLFRAAAFEALERAKARHFFCPVHSEPGRSHVHARCTCASAGGGHAQG